MALLGVVLSLVACRNSPEPVGSTATTRPSNRMPALERVAVIVMENKEFGEVIGQEETSYLTGLASDYGVARRMYGISHPSLPNYLALLGGDTFGIEENCTDCSVDAPNLVDQLEDTGISWKAYMEGMTEPCSDSDSGSYVKRHNPFMYFESISSDPNRCGKVVPLDELETDLAGGLPQFTWITPGLCNGTHDCGVDEGDQFLSQLVPPLLEALGPNGVLFITYDEGSTDEGCCGTAAGGRIPFVVAGGAAQRSVVSDSPHTLYSVLRAIEETFGLEPLGWAKCDCTSSLGEFVKSNSP
ncbi:MAG TPA: alkaline phosphatase family protein [Actinomycetota bacterium]|nr:alkaline phosphatase family protein [Actinomycetota bacterium]